MVKILETAANMVWGELFKEWAKTLDMLKSFVGISNEAEKVKQATLEDVKNSYIDLAKSLGKWDEVNLKTIENFFGKRNIIYQSEFEAFNKELSTIAAQKWWKDMSVFDKVTQIGKVLGSSVAWAAVELVAPVNKWLQFLNLAYDDKDYGVIRDNLEKLQEDVLWSWDSETDKVWDSHAEIVESKEIISPMVEWVITDTFFSKRNRDTNHDWELDDHGAIDMVSYVSKSLLAVADAKVIDTWYDSLAWNKIFIKYKYNGKEYIASYSHLAQPTKLAVWATVKKWDILWEMGNSGGSHWAHLHFKLKEVIDWKPTIIDPLTIFDPKLFRYKQWDQNVKFDDWKGADKYK